jgi:hypothetical protein
VSLGSSAAGLNAPALAGREAPPYTGDLAISWIASIILL